MLNWFKEHKVRYGLTLILFALTRKVIFLFPQLTGIIDHGGSLGIYFHADSNALMDHGGEAVGQRGRGLENLIS